MKSILFGRRHGRDAVEIILGPEATTSEQIEVRQAMFESAPVNADWAEVLMWGENDLKGRLKFLTKEQQEEQQATLKKADVEISNTRAEAEKRQADRDKKEKTDAQKRHEEEVAKLNKQHDAHRAVFDPKFRDKPKPSATPAEVRRDELLALNKSQLIALVEKIKAKGEEVDIGKGKSQLVAAILKSEGIEIQTPETE